MANLADKQDIQRAETRFEAADGLTLAASCWGDPANPVVVLSHGGGQTRHAWEASCRLLAGLGWYAVAYDHRGHGDSDWSPDGDYRMEVFARDMQAVAGQLPGTPVLVGASLGGLSAILLAGELDRAALRAVILVDITPKMNQQGADEVIAFMRQHSEHGFGSLKEAAGVVADWTGRPPRDDPSGLKKNLRQGEDGRWRWHWDPTFTSLTDDRHHHGPRIQQAANRIAVPLHLIRGRESNLVTDRDHQVFAADFPRAQVVEVDKARHMVAGDKNDIFNDGLLQLLATLDK